MHHIITGFFNLNRSASNNIWTDTFVICTFAITGTLLFYFSLFQIKKLLLKFSVKKIWSINFNHHVSICFRSLYRLFFLYNSWKILSNPLHLINAIFNIIIYPVENKDVWLFTVFLVYFYVLVFMSLNIN